VKLGKKRRESSKRNYYIISDTKSNHHHCTVEMYAHICKLDSASSILPIFRLRLTCLCVPSFQDLAVFCLVQKSPPGFFPTESGAFAAAKSERDFEAREQSAKSLSSHIQVKRSSIAISWES